MMYLIKKNMRISVFIKPFDYRKNRMEGKPQMIHRQINGLIRTYTEFLTD